MSQAFWLWSVAVAARHSWEETRGELWSYFGRVSGNPLLSRLGPVPGFVVIVLPALALQVTAATLGLLGNDPFWLAVLIGGRIGDAVFSHFIPAARGFTPNPGLPTAWVYLVDGLAIALTFSAAVAQGWTGLLVGAGFFAVLVPVFRLTGKLFRRVWHLPRA
ncbi:MAG: hypothetical protein HY553_12970 [Elusimicrobia bacterium]|nr:hypothetical protein [Elusimicrobiota bacterium]